MTPQRTIALAGVFLRVAIGASFLVATADRFGVFGPHASRNVAWGDWSHFVQYVAVLNWFVPRSLIPTLAAIETVVECALGIALLLGAYQRAVAWASAGLLMSFALTMTVALGVLAPLSYSVFSAAAGALLLGAIAADPSPSGPRPSLEQRYHQ